MKPLPPEITLLIETYQRAQIKLIDIIANTEAKRNSTVYRNKILTSVNAELKTLDKFAAEWVAKEIPISYKGGINEAYQAYRKANIDVAKVAVSQKVLKNLVDNATGQLLDANNFIGRRISDDLRKVGLEAIAQKVSMGDTVKMAKANLLQRMTDKGITTIRDKAGREIKLDAYASLVARTSTREATNTGTLQANEDIGNDLVQISQHFSSCPICSVYEGRVYSISGKDKRYPKLDEAFSGGYSAIHPNCTHNVTSYFEEFDDKADELRKESNKPFEIDPKNKASLDAYNKDQKIKADRRADRNSWEKAKLEDPENTAKTFSGYRSQQRSKHS